MILHELLFILSEFGIYQKQINMIISFCHNVCIQNLKNLIIVVWSKNEFLFKIQFQIKVIISG